MPTLTTKINGLDLEALQRLVGDIKEDPSRGTARFSASTRWIGAMASRTRIEAWSLGGRTLPHEFSLPIDEPRELLGTTRRPTRRSTCWRR